jgi:tetratricopeptide (TPR) repeat protein
MIAIKRYTILVIILGAVSVLQAQDEPIAPLLEGMKDHHHEITTDDTLAQRYFDQGLILHYGFNHAEAARSFREAQRLDPDCAMAYWGEALTFGPNINAGMSAASLPVVWESIQKAQELSANVSEKEKDYIDALASRYEENPPADRSQLDWDYADAMRELANKYPDDPDAQALFAEALMVTTAWNYWLDNGEPNSTAGEVLSTLETALKKYPQHPALNHFYIHLVEMEHPKWGVASADRLRGLVPGIGHLVHMPSHIYIHIGRFADGSIANQKAVEADQRYLNRHGAHGMYRISYMPHNSHFLWFTSSMEGRGQKCLEAANITRDYIIEDLLYQPGYGSLYEHYALPYLAMARFGMWDGILDEPEPDDELLFPVAIWHYARGLAYVRSGDLQSAQQELDALKQMNNQQTLRSMGVWGVYTTGNVIQIAINVLNAEIWAAESNYTGAIELLREAVELEHSLGYHEPPAWYAPVRQTLGAILLEAGNAREAEQVYRRDLEEWPDNGWSLFGLYQALKEQGNDSEAQQVYERFQKAWSRADIELTSSRM